VIVGDLNEDRLAQARSFGVETVDVSKGDPRDQIEQLLGVPEVDCGVDAVGFEGTCPRSKQAGRRRRRCSPRDADHRAAGAGIPGMPAHAGGGDLHQR
jgi:glutathione-independent formaldehyde dehydrogenase